MTVAKESGQNNANENKKEFQEESRMHKIMDTKDSF